MHRLIWGNVAIAGMLVLAPTRAHAQATVGLSLGGGPSVAILGLEGGYLIRPNFAVIAALTGVQVFDVDDGSGAGVLPSVGVRMWFGRVFVDAQLAAPVVFAGEVGVGVEFVKTDAAGIDLHLTMLAGADGNQVATFTWAGIGFHAYL